MLKARNPLRRLRRNMSGLAVVEFALCLPLFLLLAITGIEFTNYIVTRKAIGEVAAQVADNASRMGDKSVLRNRQVTEADVADLFTGASLHAQSYDLKANSRVILSSLEQNADGGQWIHWQRCFGNQAHASSYGNEGDGKTGTERTGMGPAGAQVSAPPGTAVMVVEIFYRHKPLFNALPLPLKDYSETAAYTVRDSRDLSGIHGSDGVPPALCS